MAASMWSNILPHVDIRWPPQDGQQGRAVGRHQACKGGQLRGTRPGRKGSWRQSTLQERAVRGDQAGRGGKLGANRLAGERLDINQAGMGVVRSD